MVKSIFLQDGEEIFVDDEDYEKVNGHIWFKDYSGNTRMIGTVLPNRKRISLTNFIKEKSFQKEKNNNFTKDNLTSKGNFSRWSRPSYNGISKYKGVTWMKNRKKWVANITVDGKTKYLGRYKSEDEAAMAYNKAVLEYWNGNGYLNKIGKDNRKDRMYTTHKHRQKRRSNKMKYYGTFSNGTKIGSRITYQKKEIFIGNFNNEEEAALTFNKCSIFLYSENTKLNNVPMTDELKQFISNWKMPDRIKILKEKEENR
ncbi:AP2 domain-containing protein [Micrococcus luteus]|uniref:AP2 domain-containing protein n=1 Tax=Micrococcus luteus TaxID=1270 RepID=UPI00343459E1